MGGYKNEGFVEVLAAQQSPENPNWFQVWACLHFHAVTFPPQLIWNPLV
jgi:hypothetical protein